MPLVEDDYMVETLTSNRADHPFDQWILPRGARCGKDLLHPETVDATVEVRSVGVVPKNTNELKDPCAASAQSQTQTLNY